MSDTAPSIPTLPASPPDRPIRQADMGDLEVEIWGPPGSGKTVLLVSLYATFSHLNMLNQFSMSADLRGVYERLITGEGTEVTKPEWERDKTKAEGEQMTNILPVTLGSGRRVRINSNAGEDILNATGHLDVEKWISARRDKVVVVCLNPFRIDQEIAWKGLRHLIAVLQSPSIGLDLPSALESACWTLFQIQSTTLNKRQSLMGLAQAYKGTRVVYDSSQPVPEDRFRWENCDEGGRKELCDELRDLIDERNRLQDPLTKAVRDGLQRLDNAMVVLTHVDMIDALLPSITFSDIERVFNYLFEGRPERMVSQQSLARLFDIKVKPYRNAKAATPGGGSVAGMSIGNLAAIAQPPGAQPAPAAQAPPVAAPTGYATRGAIHGRLRRDGALQLVNYLRAMASAGTDTPQNQLIRCRTNLKTAAIDLDASKARCNQLQHEWEKCKIEAESLSKALVNEQTERTRAESDTVKLVAEQADAKRETEKARAELKVLQAEKEQATASLLDCNSRLNEANTRISAMSTGAAGMKALQDSLDAHKIQLQDAKANFEKIKIRFSDAEQRMKVAESRAAELDKHNQEMIEEKSRLEAKLKTMEDGGLGLGDPFAPPTDEVAIQTMKTRIRELEKEIAGKAGTDRLTPDEVRDREDWEKRRFSVMKQWSAIMIRALLVMPFVAGIAWFTFKTMYSPNIPAESAKLFGVCSLITAGLFAVGSFIGILLVNAQLSPGWIKLRNINPKTRLFEIVTSVGQRLTGSPVNFTLDKSPFLSLLGIGIIRRNDTGQRYVTNEPSKWLREPEKPRQRWILTLDAITLVVVGLWIMTYLYLGS